ncbi:thiolase family protein [Lentibacillus amyloliquefaciens]|uniref:acetyl-CoA C-acetyltransferase n=1 Tax=Lentibacillus amyloliquefaciens TaxID=1472767 RepID=A0A0U4F063_9BACI|nr:acetyl-CoA C-acetyltransferase [Lentibacillus amyloliquefaciens]ALX48919.1 beta-ketoadipyl CoA thiolase [Lentibacillus amyloliquefaciens]
MENVYLVEGARTAFGRFGGSFKNTTDIELGVHAAQGALEKSGMSAEEMDELTFGNVIHTNTSSSYLARHIALKTGMKESSTALTVNRLCGSGLQAIVSSAQNIMLNHAHTALAGGTENMSQSPHVLRGTRFGSPNKAPKVDDMLWETLTDRYVGAGMGMTAENLADKYHISREEQDAFAVQSHVKAQQAIESGRFAEEIVPVTVKAKKQEVAVDEDEHVREDLKMEDLSKLPAAFKEDGTVTAGNASGINDGSAAVVLASESYVKQANVKPLARIVSWGIAGVDPNIMGIGPVPSMKTALKNAGLSLNDMGLIELNEAFAAQSLAVLKELDINPEIVNVNGGAVALGHPVGTSGSRITYSLATEMKKRNTKYGLATLCIGGGQGIAMILKNTAG